MLSLRQVFDRLMLLIGYQDPNYAQVADRAYCFTQIQGALQTMAVAGEDYYGREPLTLALAAGTAMYTLDPSVQTVLNQARLTSGQMLTKLTKRSQYMQFGPLFLGQAGVSPGAPIAFFTESLHNTASGAADSVTVNLYFAPTPDQGYTAEIDVIRCAPLYTWEQLCGTSPIIPVPHQYGESIFLPLCEWAMMTHPKWYKAELRPQVEAKYKRALKLLGMADPRRPKPDDSAPTALEIQNTPQMEPQDITK